jgi:hypothetical protein
MKALFFYFLIAPCPKAHVLLHVVETITALGATPKAIKCDNAQEFIHERKVKAWRRANQVALVRIQ